MVTYRRMLAGMQRRGALRVACTYRTVLEGAILVIAGVIPIDLLAFEHKRVYDRDQGVAREVAAARRRRPNGSVL